MYNFWRQLPRPFFALAPLADVTDAAFRQVIAEIGGPDVMYTEFVSADGLFKGGYDRLIKDLQYSDIEHPIVAQFFTNDPKIMRQATGLATELGFDGVDINMGCPDRKVCKQGSGAGLMQTPERAQELIRAAQDATKLPISVKTRLGFNTNELETWLPALLEAEPEVVIIHARTKREMSKVPAHWEEIARAIEIRDALGSETLIVGNGDVVDIDDARRKCEETGCDGAMLGRAIFGNPWLFAEIERPPLARRMRVLRRHVQLFDEYLGDVKNFAVMKKHFKSYVAGVDGSKELVKKLMDTKTVEEADAILKTF